MQVVTGEEMAGVDRFVIENLGMPGTVLMENAGRAAAHRLLDRYNKDENFLVLIGSGNNGGDGFVISRVLQDAGRKTKVCVASPAAKIKGDARLHKQLYENAGYSWVQKGTDEQFKALLQQADVIVDALLGTGISGELRQPYKTVLYWVENAGKTIVSIDIPSGVPADEQRPSAGALTADWTITLQQPKLSYYTEHGRGYYGKTEVVSIGIPPLALQKIPTRRRVWQQADVRKSWLKRPDSSHKGQNGNVGLIAGSATMPGAAALAAEGAVKSGAGLTTLGIVETMIPAIAAQVKEVTYFPFETHAGRLEVTPEQIRTFCEKKDAIAIGPGLGRSSAVGNMLAQLLDDYHGPLIVDADALHLLRDMLDKVRVREAPLILTPHPGEMGALLGCAPADVNEKRFETAETFARDYGVYVILKGRCTLVTTPKGETLINETGNAGLAKGGSGDVLTGIALAFAARLQHIPTALSTAVFIHGYAADRLLKHGETLETMTPAEIIKSLPLAFQSFSN